MRGAKRQAPYDSRYGVGDLGRGGRDNLKNQAAVKANLRACIIGGFGNFSGPLSVGWGQPKSTYHDVVYVIYSPPIYART